MACDIQVYGNDWCGVTRELREYLMTSRLEYDYFDIDRDDDAQRFVLSMNDGRRRSPLVVVSHEVVTRPTVAILRRVIREHGLQPAIRTARPIATRAEKGGAAARFSRADLAKENSRSRSTADRRPRRQRNRG